MSNFDDFLNGHSQEVEQEIVQEPEVDSEPETPEPKGEQVAAPPAVEQAKDSEPSVDDLKSQIKAFQTRAEDERRKRQELERKFQETQQQKPQQQPKEKPDFWADPDAAIEVVKGEFRQELVNTRLSMSEAMARDRWQDFDDKLAVFEEMTKKDPLLFQKMMSDPNPAVFAYRSAEKELKIREMGDPDAYRQKLEAEIRAKVEAEIREKLENEARKRADIPESIVKARGGSNKTATWSGPTDLRDVIK